MLNFFEFIKKNNRNKGNRAVDRLSFKVIFQYNYDNRDYMALLKDISANGFGFVSANHLEPGKYIEMEVIVECKEPDADLKWVALKEKARIKWVGTNQSSRLVDYDVGCEFIETDNETREKLTTILNQMLKTS